MAARSRAVVGLMLLVFDSRDAGVCARPIQMRARARPKKQVRATSRVIEFFMAGFLSEIPVRGANTTSHNFRHLAMGGVKIVIILYACAWFEVRGDYSHSMVPGGLLVMS